MAKNAVEEYVYDMRDKLYSKLEKFVSESDKDIYLAELSKTEDWLYDEGENCQKQVRQGRELLGSDLLDFKWQVLLAHYIPFGGCRI